MTSLRFVLVLFLAVLGLPALTGPAAGVGGTPHYPACELDPDIDYRGTTPWPIPLDWQPDQGTELWAHEEDGAFTDTTEDQCFNELKRVVGLAYPSAADLVPEGRTIRPAPACAPFNHFGLPLGYTSVTPEVLKVEETNEAIQVFCGYYQDEKGSWTGEGKRFHVRVDPDAETPELRVPEPVEGVIGAPTRLDIAVLDTTPPVSWPTGTIQLEEDGQLVATRTLAAADQGEVRFFTPELTAGRHDYDVRYSGDRRFEPTTAQVTVRARHRSRLVAPESVAMGPEAPVELDVEVDSESDDASGTVFVSEGGDALGEFPVAADGTSRVRLESMTDVEHALTLTYGGNDETLDSTGYVRLTRASWIDDVRVQTRPYGEDEWVANADEGAYDVVVDGNPARLRVSLTNPTGEPADVPLQVFDPDGRLVDNSTQTVSLDARQSADVYVTIDTTGDAWLDGKPQTGPRDYRVAVEPPAADPVSWLEPLRVDPLPAVLVHGWNSSAAGWQGFPTLLKGVHPRLQAYAVGDGQFPGTMNTGDILNPGTTLSVADNAAQLAAYVEGVRTATGARQVDLIAHSMGGLISRQYVATLMPESEDGPPVARHLVQMGTPNMGSPCADRLLEASALHLRPLMFPQPSTLQLSTTWANQFNSALTSSAAHLRGVKLSNLVGTGIPLPCGVPVDSDVVVPTWSARWTLPAADLPERDVMHTDMTASERLVQEYVVPRLSDATGSRAGGRHRASSASSAPADDARTFAAETLEIADGSGALAIDVPAGTEFGVTAVAPDVTVELVDPDGVVRATAGPQSGATPFLGLSADPRDGGRWTVRGAASGSTGVPLVLWIAGSAVDLRVERAETDASGTATITAEVTGTSSATVTALATDGTRQTQPVTLARGSDGSYSWTGDLDPALGTLVVRADVPGHGTRVTAAALSRGPAGPVEPTPGAPVTPGAQQATSTTTAKVRLSATRNGRAVVTVVSSGTAPTGTVEVWDRGRRIGAGVVGPRGSVTVRLPKAKAGTHVLRVRYLGSVTVLASVSRKIRIRV